MKKILLVMLIALMSCNPDFDDSQFGAGSDQHTEHEVESVEIHPDVISETVVIKKVYVNEQDYTGYESDLTEGVSYWYVQYENKAVRGYNCIEISSPYADIAKIHQCIIKDSGFDPDEYVQINFFHRIPLESYLTYNEYDKD